MSSKIRRVVIESPYAGDVFGNVKYARECIKDSLQRGEAPLASHLLYTQPSILDDNIPAERMQGILAGLAWQEVADAVIVYLDKGMSRGMQQGVDRAKLWGIPVEYRRIKE